MTTSNNPPCPYSTLGISCFIGVTIPCCKLTNDNVPFFSVTTTRLSLRNSIAHGLSNESFNLIWVIDVIDQLKIKDVNNGHGFRVLPETKKNC